MNKKYTDHDFTQQDVTIEQEQFVYQGYFRVKEYKLRHRLFEGGQSHTVTREVFMRGNAVGVLLYDPKEKVAVLIEQFRPGALNHPITPWLIEVVAGGIPRGETAEATAKKEIWEETGLTVDTVHPITTYYVSPGGNSEQIHLFYALVDSTKADGIHGLKEENEDIRIRKFSLQDCADALASGAVNNAMTLISLQWLQLHHHHL